VWNWREEEAVSKRTERVKYGTCGGRDTVIEDNVERNKKRETFCPSCRTGKEVL